jgi:hypothetical protein
MQQYIRGSQARDLSLEIATICQAAVSNSKSLDAKVFIVVKILRLPQFAGKP